jgi:TusA-related sulfurtransferase
VNTRSLNVLGEICPVPLMRTQEAVAQLAPGDELVVEVDFVRSVRNIMQWCTRHHYSYKLDDLGPLWRITICKH